MEHYPCVVMEREENVSLNTYLLEPPCGGRRVVESFLYLTTGTGQLDTSMTPLPMRYAIMGYTSMGFTSMGYTSTELLNL